MIFKNLKDKFFDKGNRRGTSLVTLSLEQSGSNKNLGKSQLYTAFTAFTLAEILIVLGVIGVLAAMTIPTLIANYEQSQRVVALKKVYSTLSNVVNKLIADNGGTLKNLCNSGDSDCIRDEFLNNLVYTKKCTSTWDCFPQSNVLWLNLDSSNPGVGANSTAQMSDGSLFHFWHISDNCSSNYGAQIVNLCSRIVVDINGFKKPNITGKDIFFFWLTSNGLKTSGNGLACDGNGISCTNYYLLR